MQPVYMYHAVGAGTELRGADFRYSVTPEAFKRHLARIGRSVALARQLAREEGIGAPSITFDDGHLTHFTNAFPALLDAGMSAEFYVNPALVERPGFVDWTHLRDMAGQGMSIQSHSLHHVFLPDLDQAMLRRELDGSKKMIEDEIGAPVLVLAPPGGRYDRRTIETALEVGYRRLAVSRPGLWSRFDDVTIPRFPVYAHTADATVGSYRRPWSRDTLRAVWRYRLARLGQRAFGNQRYDRLRNGIVGRPS